MSDYRAVLFDLDGTLIDSFAAITASVNHVRGHFGLPPLPESDVRRYVGWGLHNLMPYVLPGHDPDEGVRLYREHHPTVMAPMTRLMPGVAETLPRLAAGGLRLAVCSNKLGKFSAELLGALGIADLFDAVMGPEHVAHPKPAPDMLLAAMDRLGTTLAETLYVGDMSVDIEAGRAAGVTVWVVPTGAQDEATVRSAGPDRVIGGISDLVALLRPAGGA